jgi:glycosyltransferase involved in cell wall biosynthesis
MSSATILFLITDLNTGGAETQLVRLAKRLAVRGWGIRVGSLMTPNTYVDELEQDGIPVFSLGIQHTPLTPWPGIQLARYIRAWQPHVVHSFMVHANLLARMVRPLASVPVLICSARSTDEGGRLREILYRLTDPLCDLTTQVSQAGLDRYVRVGAVPRHKIRHIPNGVDVDRFCPDPKARRQVRGALYVEEAFVWLAVGRLSPPKDYPSMLHAFARLAEERPEALLLIAGDGPLRTNEEALAHDLGLEDRVRFLGIRRDVPELMNAADAYVMSSAWEGMPNVLLEAGATGLPIVATDVGGNREVVVDDKTGVLVPAKNPKALAQAMLDVMDRAPEHRRAMGEAGRMHVNAHYSLDAVVDQWEMLYRELLEKKGIAP